MALRLAPTERQASASTPAPHSVLTRWAHPAILLTANRVGKAAYYLHAPPAKTVRLRCGRLLAAPPLRLLTWSRRLGGAALSPPCSSSLGAPTTPTMVPLSPFPCPFA